MVKTWGEKWQFRIGLILGAVGGAAFERTTGWMSEGAVRSFEFLRGLADVVVVLLA